MQLIEQKYLFYTTLCLFMINKATGDKGLFIIPLYPLSYIPVCEEQE